jgi:uncharacterized protein (DUF885 family)
MGGDFRKIDKRGMDEIISHHHVVTAARSISWAQTMLARIRMPRQTRIAMKTAVLVSAAALWCVPCLAQSQGANERMRNIYTEEWKWRLEQFPGIEGVEKPVPDRLPRVDPVTQEMRLRYWQDVLHKLDDVPRAQLSPEEQINYDVYRPEIENFVADQKFRDYEMPVNSDSAFWSDLSYTARRPFKTLTDYKNWIAQMRDIPRYFREQIANMRAGLARGFTPHTSLCRDARNPSQRLRRANPKTTCSTHRSGNRWSEFSRPTRTSSNRKPQR